MAVEPGKSPVGSLSLLHLDRACVGLIEAHVSGRLTLVNRYCRNLLGYHEAELLQLSLSDIAIPDPSSLLHAGWWPPVAGEPQDGATETTLRRKDGAPLRVLTSIQAVRRGVGGAPDTLFILFVLADAWQAALPRQSAAIAAARG